MTDQLSRMRIACGSCTETLFVEPVAPQRYVLRSVPFHAYGLALNDTVEVTPTDAGLAYKAVVSRSGLYTVRAQFHPHIGLHSEIGASFLESLMLLGHEHEILERDQLIAIAIEPGHVFLRLAARLSRLGHACVWETAHPTTGRESLLRPPSVDEIEHQRPAPLSAATA